MPRVLLDVLAGFPECGNSAVRCPPEQMLGSCSPNKGNKADKGKMTFHGNLEAPSIPVRSVNVFLPKCQLIMCVYRIFRGDYLTRHQFPPGSSGSSSAFSMEKPLPPVGWTEYPRSKRISHANTGRFRTWPTPPVGSGGAAP